MRNIDFTGVAAVGEKEDLYEKWLYHSGLHHLVSQCTIVKSPLISAHCISMYTLVRT